MTNPQPILNVDATEQQVELEQVLSKEELQALQAPELSEINLRSRGLNAEQMQAILSMIRPSSQLATIILSGNNITTVAAITLATLIRQCPNLTELQLWGTGLSGEWLVAVIDALKDKTKLQRLELGYNDFSDGRTVDKLVEVLPSLTALQDFAIAKNHLGDAAVSRICKALQHAYNLNNLELGQNAITEVGLQSVGQLLTAITPHVADNTRLALRLWSNNIQALNDDFVAPIHNYRKLDLLDLGGNGLSDVAAEGICKIISGNSHLHTLYLWQNKLNNLSAAVLANSLKQLPNLQVVNWEGNQIDDDLACALASGLAANTTLEKLALTNDKSGKHFTHVGGRAIASLLSNKPMLKELHLGGHKIGRRATKLIAQNLRLVPNRLETLMLWGNAIEDEASIAELITLIASQCGTLKVLDLGSIQIGCQGQKFVEALADNTCLQELSLWGAGLNDDCIIRLAASLSNNQALHQLHLGSNPLTDKSLEAIKALTTKPGFIRLGLHTTQLSDPALAEIVSTLPNSLIELNLATSHMAELTMQALAKRLNNGDFARLQTLHLANQPLTAELNEALKPYLTRANFTLNVDKPVQREVEILTKKSAPQVQPPIALSDASEAKQTEAKQFAEEAIPVVVEIPEELTCHQGGKIMYQPVYGSDGNAYEKEVYDKNNKCVVSLNHQKAIKRFLAAHPEHWQNVYLPMRFEEPLAQVKAAGKLQPLLQLLKQEFNVVKPTFQPIGADLLDLLFNKLGTTFLLSLSQNEQQQLVKVVGEAFGDDGATFVTSHLNWQQADYYNALMSFIETKADQMVKVLLEMMQAKGFKDDIDKTNHLNQWPLYLAVQSQNALITQYLLQAGAKSNAVDYLGNTVLHLVAMQALTPDLEQIIKCLLKHDANVELLNNAKEKAIELTVGNLETKNYLTRQWIELKYPAVIEHYQQEIARLRLELAEHKKQIQAPIASQGTEKASQQVESNSASASSQANPHAFFSAPSSGEPASPTRVGNEAPFLDLVPRNYFN